MKTSISFFFLGAATLFLVVVEAATHPGTVAPVAVNPTPAPATIINNVCQKTNYTQLCEIKVKHKSDPVKALLGNIYESILLARQTKDIARKNMKGFELQDVMGHLDEVIDGLVTSIEDIKHPGNIYKGDLTTHLSGAHITIGTACFDEVSRPPPVDQICKTLLDMTSNSLAICDLLP